jgi:hypothetical protein
MEQNQEKVDYRKTDSYGLDCPKTFRLSNSDTFDGGCKGFHHFQQLVVLLSGIRNGDCRCLDYLFSPGIAEISVYNRF